MPKQITITTEPAVQTLTFEDAWEQQADRRNHAALAAKDRFEARLLQIIEQRATALLDGLAS
jgi:hypothetical protein